MYFKGPTTGEMLGLLAIVAGFFIGVGVFLAWAVPALWEWVKPWLHAVTG